MSLNIFKDVEVKVPHRSGFDKSFKNLLTMPVGTLVPLVCDEVIPNTRVKLKTLLSASLPPLASDTFMRCQLKLEAFFVPMRILYGGFESWLTKEPISSGGSTLYAGFPYLSVGKSTANAVFKPAKSVGGPNFYYLSDYLGIKFKESDLAYIGDNDVIDLNPLPFLAYHKIWNDWYRNPLITQPCFTKPSNSAIQLYNLPFQSSYSADGSPFYVGGPVLADGISLFSTRQRNFGLDYFTSATTSPQLGDAQSVTVETSGSDSVVTIAALRAANSLQQFAERNNLSGYRLVDYVRAHYGAHLTDGNAQRPLYLGSGSIDIYNKGVSQTAAAPGGSSNPFDSVGSQYGQAVGSGEVSLIDDFVAAEPGYIFVICSLVPKATYSSGFSRMFKRYIKLGGQTDMANPLLQNVGNQPIYQFELEPSAARRGNGAGYENQVFGYQQRYADFMTREDELHGLLRDGESLESFALQRYLGQGSSLNSDFIKIPRTYLDQVSATSSAISNYGLWVDSFIDYKVSMPLNMFSIPSLQDPSYEHGETKIIRRGGVKID